MRQHRNPIHPRRERREKNMSPRQQRKLHRQERIRRTGR